MSAQTEAVMLRAGQLVTNFRLPAVNRDGQVGPWDYKQHRNLVIIFFRSAECQKCKQLLQRSLNTTATMNRRRLRYLRSLLIN